MSGTRGLVLLMKNLNTSTLRPYLVNMKDSSIRDQLLQSIEEIKTNVAVINFNGMAKQAIKYPRLHPVVPRHGFQVPMTLEFPGGQFKISTITSKSDMSRSYLDSLVASDMPPHAFLCSGQDIFCVEAGNRIQPRLVYVKDSKMREELLESTSFKCVLISRPRPYGLTALSTLQYPPTATRKFIGWALARCAHKSKSSLAVSNFTAMAEKAIVKNIPNYIKMCRDLEVKIASSSSSTTEPAAELAAVPFSEPPADSTAGTVVETTVETPAETSVEPASQTALETIMETPVDTHCASPVKINHTVTAKNVNSRISGWVASKVRFFNGIAEQSKTAAVSGSRDPIDTCTRGSTKEIAADAVPPVAVSAVAVSAVAVSAVAVSAEALPAAPAQTRTRARPPAPAVAPAGAPIPERTSAFTPPPARTRAVQTISNKTTAQEAEKWVSYFCQPENMANEDGGIILPSIGSPVELLSCWFFIPRMAKKIITSAGGPYNETLFFVAVAFLEIDAKRKKTEKRSGLAEIAYASSHLLMEEGKKGS
ncbi:hypothetical protein BJ741DRAFT_660160 [Chytriomyces cf. hyalinus JEL632]|nr:hypothetical protein BJ741DRAFT_660160 [Chytriomyces cf. hyalinus JEL632]